MPISSGGQPGISSNGTQSFSDSEELAINAMRSLDSHNKNDSPAPTQEMINNDTLQMNSVENEALCAPESLSSNKFNTDMLSHFYNTEQTECAGATVIDLHLDDSSIKYDTEINFVDLPLNNSFDIQLDTNTGRNNDLPSTSSSLTEVRNRAHNSPHTTGIHQNLASVHPSIKKINEFHLSRLKPTTTCQMVIDFMTRRGVPESLMRDVKVWPLTPKDRDPSTLSFVSFKIDAFADVANIINRINFWPSSTIFKNFVHRTKTKTRTLADLSLNCNDSDFPEMGKPKAQHRINSNISSIPTV